MGGKWPYRRTQKEPDREKGKNRSNGGQVLFWLPKIEGEGEKKIGKMKKINTPRRGKERWITLRTSFIQPIGEKKSRAPYLV